MHVPPSLQQLKAQRRDGPQHTALTRHPELEGGKGRRPGTLQPPTTTHWTPLSNNPGRWRTTAACAPGYCTREEMQEDFEGEVCDHCEIAHPFAHGAYLLSRPAPAPLGRPGPPPPSLQVEIPDRRISTSGIYKNYFQEPGQWRFGQSYQHSESKAASGLGRSGTVPVKRQLIPTRKRGREEPPGGPPVPAVGGNTAPLLGPHREAGPSSGGREQDARTPPPQKCPAEEMERRAKEMETEEEAKWNRATKDGDGRGRGPRPSAGQWGPGWGKRKGAPSPGRRSPLKSKQKGRLGGKKNQKAGTPWAHFRGRDKTPDSERHPGSVSSMYAWIIEGIQHV
ncbi:hypothetical protein GWK47_024689 [Chionoecetes opilio]|uniref:Uncharacterized protein n=1 Tax=Chionoecetes opilio TaxID=41210 RepID=A0A8J4XPP0_CHIOP|nr:hypothetical protein GWK47_024689 [Chionoecetes opilio]